MEWAHLCRYVLLILAISDKIHQCFLSPLSEWDFSIALFMVIVFDVVCINMFVKCRVGYKT